MHVHRTGGVLRRSTRVLVLLALTLTITLLISPALAMAAHTLWWQELAPRPVSAQAAAAGQAGGYIWVLGGKTQPTGSHVLGGAISRVDRYNPVTNTWTANIASLDMPRAGSGYVTRGQYIYLFGGSTNTGHLSTVTAFDTVTMTSMTIGSMARVRHGARAALIGDTAYIVGGRDENDVPLDSIEAFQLDPGGMSGTSLGIVATVPPARFYPGIWAQDGELYVAGGRTSPSTATDTGYKITPTPGSTPYPTVPIPPLPDSRWAQVGVELSNGAVYIANAAPPVPTVSFNKSLANPWQLEGSMPMQRHAPGVVSYDDKMYSIGGYLNPPDAPVSEVYDNNNVALLITLNDRQSTPVTGPGTFNLTVQGNAVSVNFPLGTTVNAAGAELVVATMPKPPGGVPTGFAVDANGQPVNGTIFEIMTNAEFTPGALTITVPYAGGKAPQVWHWNGKTWDDFTSQIVSWDKTAKTVTFTTTTLSPFAVFEGTPDPEPVSTSAASLWSVVLLALLGMGVTAIVLRRARSAAVRRS